MDSFRYKAFISYSHADERAVARLHRRLEQYVVPAPVVSKLGLDDNRVRPIFKDREELAAASSLSASLQQALDSSAFLIVACSPAARSSRWIDEEIRYFRRHHDPDRVLCVIVAGADEDEVFPDALTFDIDDRGELDRNRPLEPLAADWRAEGDGPTAATLKLIAAIIGADFDDLAQRDRVLRMRRLRLVALASSAGMLLTLALATYALLQRNEADRQRVIAEEERAAAEREAATSKRVVTFLADTFRVADPATENPREITAVEILDRGSERIRQELSEEPEIRATLMATIGGVYENLGLFEPAEELTGTSLELDRSDPARTAERLTALAEIKWRRSKLDEIEPLLVEAEALLDSTADRTLLEARIGTIRGFLLLQAQTLDEARREFEAALEGFRSTLGEADPLTAQAKSRLSVLLQELGEFDTARTLLDEAVVVYERNFGVQHSETATLVQNRASLNYKSGAYAQALADIDQALEILHGILGDSHPTLATAYLNRGRILTRLERAEAIEAFQRALEIGRTHLGREHGFLVLTLFEAAVAHARFGALADALAALEETDRILAVLYPPDHPQTAFVTTQTGVVYGESGDPKTARQYCEQGISELQALSTALPAHIDMARRECADWIPE